MKKTQTQIRLTGHAAAQRKMPAGNRKALEMEMEHTQFAQIRFPIIFRTDAYPK